MVEQVTGRTLILTLLTVSMVLSGCITDEDDDTIKPGPLQTLNRSVDLGTAEEVEVYLENGAGHVELRPGAARLMDAQFKFNIERWRPAISYEQQGGVWNLSVIQPNQTLVVGSGARNDWALMLGEDVPKELGINVGAGNADCKVSGLNLTHLWITAGAGNIELDMTGAWEANLSVSLNAGVGNIEIDVPSDVGVRLIPVVGVGDVSATGFTMHGSEYRNSAYDTATVILTISANAGVGQIRVGEV